MSASVYDDLVRRLRAMAPRPDDGGEEKSNRRLYVEAADAILALSTQAMDREKVLEEAAAVADQKARDWQESAGDSEDSDHVNQWAMQSRGASIVATRIRALAQAPSEAGR